MKTNVLLALASLALVAATASADPGGQPNQNSRKKRGQRVEAGQRADEVRIIAIGGYRQENLYDASERWRADKAQAARDAKALRDREAQERLAREETRRSDARARQDREKLSNQERRDAEKRRQADAARAKAAQGADRRAQAKRDRATDRQARR